MAKKNDPNKIKPNPKGKFTMWDAFWIVLAFAAAAGAGGGVAANNRQDDRTPHKPVPHSTISPEGVKPLPKEK